MGWGAGRACLCSLTSIHVQEACGPSPVLKNFPLPLTPPQPALIFLSQPKSTGNHQDKITSPPITFHRLFCLPSTYLAYRPPSLANWLKRGSIRKKLRRGQSSMAPFFTLRSHTLRPLYSLWSFLPSFLGLLE